MSGPIADGSIASRRPVADLMVGDQTGCSQPPCFISTFQAGEMHRLYKDAWKDGWIDVWIET